MFFWSVLYWGRILSKFLFGCDSSSFLYGYFFSKKIGVKPLADKIPNVTSKNNSAPMCSSSNWDSRSEIKAHCFPIHNPRLTKNEAFDRVPIRYTN